MLIVDHSGGLIHTAKGDRLSNKTFETVDTERDN